jgi:hypothetical protein
VVVVVVVVLAAAVTAATATLLSVEATEIGKAKRMVVMLICRPLIAGGDSGGEAAVAVLVPLRMRSLR